MEQLPRCCAKPKPCKRSDFWTPHFCLGCPEQGTSHQSSRKLCTSWSHLAWEPCSPRTMPWRKSCCWTSARSSCWMCAMLPHSPTVALRLCERHMHWKLNWEEVSMNESIRCLTYAWGELRMKLSPWWQILGVSKSKYVFSVACLQASELIFSGNDIRGLFLRMYVILFRG